MTASKSSRARNARSGAQTAAARNGSQGQGASATAVPGGTRGAGGARKGGTATATRNGTTARNGASGSNETAGRNAAAVKNGPAARNGTAARSGSAARSGKRGPVAAEVLSTESGPAPWLQVATFLVAIAGLGVSIYLTIAHFTESTLAGCSETGLVNCTKVTTSPQSYVFGIPVAVLGLVFFVFAVAIMSPWAWQATRREIHILRLASVVVGIGFVLYLVYAELFIIGSICLYCTSVHVLTFILFVLTAFAAAAWGLKPGKAWKVRLPGPSASAAAEA
jgi:uncharacterized membrane protein